MEFQAILLEGGPPASRPGFINGHSFPRAAFLCLLLRICRMTFHLYVLRYEAHHPMRPKLKKAMDG